MILSATPEEKLELPGSQVTRKLQELGSSKEKLELPGSQVTRTPQELECRSTRIQRQEVAIISPLSELDSGQISM